MTFLIIINNKLVFEGKKHPKTFMQKTHEKIEKIIRINFLK